jgi:hypothetical protein
MGRVIFSFRRVLGSLFIFLLISLDLIFNFYQEIFSFIKNHSKGLKASGASDVIKIFSEFMINLCKESKKFCGKSLKKFSPQIYSKFSKFF